MDHEEIQTIDAKIRQWSGKQEHIRSLLSTLQYVLWADSGSKPVPITDIIEGRAVKKSYQKALLCLHPDKLQQKGAASYKKYIAEKVFDILQDAWTQFNSLNSI
ncbi:J domain-containing protein required for chloroplast accumulation response 1-like [Hibiscus syriacus]|uniref:J domain-containing protein required for chloroplast accumulation response 1-like n=1 Tax=Hibiscus syriacus TaxID=106335 RepID=UPI0019239718|nr:J domain-containing protein required for chloroplast accumulation response 1-like [Hibiscus syriacus]